MPQPAPQLLEQDRSDPFDPGHPVTVTVEGDVERLLGDVDIQRRRAEITTPARIGAVMGTDAAIGRDGRLGRLGGLGRFGGEGFVGEPEQVRAAVGLAITPSAFARRRSHGSLSPSTDIARATVSKYRSRAFRSGTVAFPKTVPMPCLFSRPNQTPWPAIAASTSDVAWAGSARRIAASTTASNRGYGNVAANPAVDASTFRAASRVSGRVRTAILRAIHTVTSPVFT